MNTELLDGGGDALGHLDLLLAHAIAANGRASGPSGEKISGVKTREAIRKPGRILTDRHPRLLPAALLRRWHKPASQFCCCATISHSGCILLC
jgi:hypothetical protein